MHAIIKFQMEILYQHKSLGVPLFFKVVYINQLKSQPKKLPTFGGDAGSYLQSFCKYAAQLNRKGRMWDHALLLTGLTLKSNGDSSTIGNRKQVTASRLPTTICIQPHYDSI